MDRQKIIRATSPSPWDATNHVLYELCRRAPTHTDRSQILAKVMLIGRSYSAEIERQRPKKDGEDSERFYESVVAPAIEASDIDNWLSLARRAEPASHGTLDVVVQVHGKVTALFNVSVRLGAS